MTDAPPEIDVDAAPDSAGAPEATDPAEVARQLQDENRRLWDRIEQLQSDETAAADASGALAEAAQENEQLRERLGELAVRESLRKAAAALGLSDEAVSAHAHRFTCIVEPGGRPRIEPNPTEFLLQQIKADPLLARAVADADRTRRADVAIHAAEGPAAVDPVELLSVLDRDAGKKSRFIARHGTAAFVDLAAKARRKGYRG